MAVGVTFLLRGGVTVPRAACNDLQPKVSRTRRLSLRSHQACNNQLHDAFPARAPLSTAMPSTSCTSKPRHNAARTWSSPQFKRANKSLTVAAASSAANGKSPDQPTRTRAKRDVATLREKLNNYIANKAGYFWLAGPAVTTAAVVVPPAVIPLVDLLQKNYWLGLLATFGLDIIFVLAADLFFVLADKAGHQQAVPGGPVPWTGPWEATGYPKGEPTLTKLIAYAGFAVGALGILVSLFLGKLAVGLPALGSYLALIFIQVAYERLLRDDRVPAYPLVPIVYTVYRFKQLARGMELVAVMGGGVTLAMTIRALMVVWTFYLGMHLTQIPWLYSTWNSNHAT